MTLLDDMRAFKQKMDEEARLPRCFCLVMHPKEAVEVRARRAELSEMGFSWLFLPCPRHQAEDSIIETENALFPVHTAQKTTEEKENV